MKIETDILYKKIPSISRNSIYPSRTSSTGPTCGNQEASPYFQAHPIVVLTNLPLQNTIHKLGLLGRMARWAIELSEFGIQYKPHLELKGHVLVDFLIKLP